MTDICPLCGSTAVLLQTRDESEDVPDLSSPTATMRLAVKVEEYRCQNLRCEHEFETILREPAA
jgi:hypothetical protein